MTTISEFLVPDHKRCDHLFAAAEAAVAGQDWVNASAGFEIFQEALQHHFSMEEDIMFPAFEGRTGMRQGPTMVMRSEHGQMTELLKQMSDAIGKKDENAFLGNADTLLILMQQHNVKEEQMLYQMADQVLSGELEQVVGRMRAMA